MPDAERLTDERVREILERILLWEPSARLRGDVEVREIVAALDELLDRRLAARAGDREEREGLAAAVGRASMQPGIGHYCADGFEGALKRYREAVLAYRAAPGGETRAEG